MSEILSENEFQMIEDLHRYSDTGQSRTIRSLINSHRAMQAERDTLLAWKKIILGTGTEQEAVIRMAATEYTQTAIESWKLANEKLTKERDALRAELAKLRKEQK